MVMGSCDKRITRLNALYLQEHFLSSCNFYSPVNFQRMNSAATFLSGVLGDAARGLAQQMVWWGHDVRHPDGNLLVRHGMTRRPSPGLTGTSCYALTWEGGLIELHGAVASWVSADVMLPGVVYSRDQGRVALWRSGVPPVPGREFGCHGPADERWRAALPLIRWIAGYESWIDATAGSAWRLGCWRAIRRLPKGKPWLPPGTAREWWEQAATAQQPVRANRGNLSPKPSRGPFPEMSGHHSI
jgi:hypothetical protein